MPYKHFTLLELDYGCAKVKDLPLSGVAEVDVVFP